MLKLAVCPLARCIDFDVVQPEADAEAATTPAAPSATRYGDLFMPQRIRTDSSRGGHT
jgi:hypothetical protein